MFYNIVNNRSYICFCLHNVMHYTFPTQAQSLNYPFPSPLFQLFSHSIIHPFALVNSILRFWCHQIFAILILLCFFFFITTYGFIFSTNPWVFLMYQNLGEECHNVAFICFSKTNNSLFFEASKLEISTLSKQVRVKFTNSGWAFSLVSNYIFML